VLLPAAASAGAAFVLYLAVGLVRYSTGRSGNYDLGIFSQAARSWSEGRWPGSAIRGLDNLFADHFSPITAVFGVAWRVWPDPRVLVVTQALALAVAVLLVALAAFGHLRTPVAALLVVGVVLAQGAVSAAVFDVHETGLGAPLMAGLCLGLLERRRGLVVGCALGLLLVKEDLGLTVVVAGLLWWWPARDRHTGLFLAAAGVAGLVVAFAVVLAVNPEHSTPYLQFLTGASGNAQGLPGIDVTGGRRWEPALLFAATAGVVGLRSPIALLAAPTLLWRAVSSNEAYWQTYFHYDVLLVPVAAVALVDVLARPSRRPVLVTTVGLVALGVAASLGVAKLSAWPILDPGAYRLSPRLQAATQIAGRLPAGDAVAVQQELGPVFISRLDVRMLSTLPAGPVRWVVLTPDGSSLGASASAKQAWLAAHAPGAEVTTVGGVVVVHLPAPQVVQLPEDPVSAPRP
jgi:uncharacterized membrane protein